MANEFKITDIVDKKAFDELTSLIAKFNETKEAYVNLTKDLAGGLRVKPGDLKELADKTEKYTNIMNQLVTTQNKLSDIQGRYKGILNDLNKNMKEFLSLSSLSGKFDSLTSAINKASDALKIASEAQKDNAQTTQRQAQAMQSASSSISLTSSAYAEILNTVTSYDNKAKELNERLSANKIRLDEIRRELSELSKELSKGIISQQEYLNKVSDLTIKERDLVQQNKQYTSLLNAHSKAMVSTAGSYNEMSAAVVQLENRFRNLSEAQRQGDQGVGLIKQIKQLKDELKAIDAQMGNYQRNVGNYTSHWNGLNASVQQVARELPSLAVGWNTFFLAISNNLPIMADEIKRARDEFKALQESGQKGVPVWKQLTKSILNWQTALVVGITLLSVYGKDIMNWIENLFKAKEVTGDLIDYENKLLIARQKGIQDISRETTKLDLLYKTTQDTNKLRKERLAAANALQKMYPDYLGNMKKESILAGEAKEAYMQLRKELVASAIARAQLDEMTKIAAQRYKAWVKERNAYVSYLRSENELSKNNSDLQKTITLNAKKQWENAKDSLSDYDKALKGMSESIDVDALVNDSNDANKKEAEEYANYMKNIESELTKTRIALIEDRRKAEIASVENTYKENINKIKGYSAKENQLRSQYEEEKNKNIRDINEKYDLEREEYESDLEKRSIELKLDTIKNNSEKELEYKLDLLLRMNEILREEEIREAERRGEDVELINKKYDARFSSIIQDNISERLGLIKKGTDRELDILDTNSLKEINALNKQYKQGEINEKQYRDGIYRITKESGEAKLKLLLKEAEAELALSSDLPQEKVDEIQRRIDKIKAQIEDFGNDMDNDENNPGKRWADDFNNSLGNLSSSANKYLGDSANIFNALGDIIGEITAKMDDAGDSVLNFWGKLDDKGKLSFVLSSFAKIQDGITSIMTDIYDARIKRVEEEQEANEEAGEKELERIEKLENSGVITKEEAEARKRAAEQTTANKNKELEKKKEALQQKQAKWEKANAISQSIIATALAVSRALPNMVLAALVGALGAAQLATIIAQPIPKYAKGTDNHPGGLAIVGDGGKHEAVVTDRGAYITPNVPTLIDLPRRAKVIPDVDIERRSDFLPPFDRLALYRSMNLRSDIGALMKDAERMGEPITVNVNNDYRKLEREMQSLNRSFEKMAKYQKKAAKEAELRNISNRI
ncbi:hypothetical protein M067_4976 [Bacteroides fragilis str. J-143-4]|uniref:hypothetical protein n=1 Tax=Bacteroides fragilis TaxID=817 RepID=UPI00044B7C1C|nr:hypothetical protein [Bacteroides fragilis]EXZ16714.1 hypothetical protein M067_4976 [Bacteroides fragilis str. J-143-4]